MEVLDLAVRHPAGRAALAADAARGEVFGAVQGDQHASVEPVHPVEDTEFLQAVGDMVEHAVEMLGRPTPSSMLRMWLSVGRLDYKDILRLNQSVMVFLGLAVSPRSGRKG